MRRKRMRDLELPAYMRALAAERTRHSEESSHFLTEHAESLEWLDTLASALGISIESEDWWDSVVNDKRGRSWDESRFCVDFDLLREHQMGREKTTVEGTPADLTRVADISKVKGRQPGAIAKVLTPMSDGLRERGYTWFRVTAPDDDEDHVYLEAWLVRPKKEGTLNRAAANTPEMPPASA